MQMGTRPFLDSWGAEVEEQHGNSKALATVETDGPGLQEP